MEHSVSRSTLKRFSTGAATKEERQQVVAHVLRECTICAAILRDLARPRVPARGYGAALDRFEREMRRALAPPLPLPLPAEAPQADRDSSKEMLILV
jgi:hypothetical protein